MTASLLGSVVEYNSRVCELFGHLHHAGTVDLTDAVLNARAGSHEQGAACSVRVVVSDGVIQVFRYQAYGCPHFLAACELLASDLEGRRVTEITAWNWRAAEAELAVPAAKRARLLLLDEIVTQLSAVPVA